MSEILIVGYGNTLRRDDGVGPAIVEAVSAWNFPEVRCATCHQLTPELAAQIAEARAVVFVDAARGGASKTEAREVERASVNRLATHTGDPASLLSLARRVYGHCPPAWLLTVPAEDFEFGEGFSKRAAEAVPNALEKLRALLEQIG